MRRLKFGPIANRVAIAAASVACVGATAVVLTTPVAAGGATVTYSASVTLPAQPSSNFAGAGGGGDGWAVALSATRLYNVFHHISALEVECHLQSNSSVCPGYPKTVTDGASHNFATSIAPGLYLNQANGRLYVPVVRTSDFTGGVACIDTQSSSSNPFCGFTSLTPAGDSPITTTSGLSDPLQVGTNWYVFNEVPGAPTGAMDKMLCFSLKTFSACGGQPYTYNYGGMQLSSFTYSFPMGASGTNLYTQLVGSSLQLACFNTKTHAACAGSWPVTVTGAAGAPFPKLNAAGSPVGICAAITGTPCFTPTGATSATPAAMPTAMLQGYQYSGPSVTLGAKVYMPDSAANAIDCFNFATNKSCDNFPHVFSNLGLLYTVNVDPFRSSCLWVNADDGSAQIQNFDAFSAGGCGESPYRIFAAQIVATPHACVPATYTSLSVTKPAYQQYKAGTVDFESAGGVPIPGIPTHHLVKGTTSLKDLHLSAANKLPQFLLTLTKPPASLKSVTIKVEWAGKYNPNCVSHGTAVANAGPPGPPRNVGGHVKPDSSSVTWQTPSTDGHSPITGYSVTAYDAAGHKVGSCSTQPPTLTCDIAGSFNLTTIYTFKVIATNAVGHSTPGVGYSEPLVPTAATSPIVATPVKVTG